MKRKIIFMIIIYIGFGVSLFSQSITNVRAESDGNKIVVIYNLQSDVIAKVSLYVSEDGGKNFTGPLKSVSGDIGFVESGADKKIVWDVLKEREILLGNSIVFRVKALPLSATFEDSRDGKTYRYVTIGRQVWMAENLAYLPAVSPPTKGSRLTPHYYVYGYNGTSVSSARATGNYRTYGVLYNWAAAMNGAGSSDANPSGVQGVCPTGWHLPSDSEWKELEMYLGMSQAEADERGWRGTDEGGKMKETGTAHWNSPNTGATNSSGFTALLGGYRSIDGTFYPMYYYAVFWSSTEGSSYDAWDRLLGYDYSEVGRLSDNKAYGFSVRCLRD